MGGVILMGGAGPAPSVGGLRRGAARLRSSCRASFHGRTAGPAPSVGGLRRGAADRKSTRLNSSHTVISYAVFCLKKKKNKDNDKMNHDTLINIKLQRI